MSETLLVYCRRINIRRALSSAIWHATFCRILYESDNICSEIVM
jgi:hypothetical protein